VRTFRVAAAIVGVEGVAAIVAGIGFMVAALVGHPDDRGTSIFLGLLLSAYGVGIVLAARGFGRGRHWARTPAFLTQFFAFVVAWYNRHSLPAVMAIVAGTAAAAVVFLAISERRRSRLR
jgi:O-antigen/teichoic acid export membrane protein